MAFKVIIRHAQSVHNAAMKPYYETGDTSLFTTGMFEVGEREWALTEAGWKQAAVTGEWLRQEFPATRFDNLYVSPYARTRQTAEALNTGMEPAYDERLREQSWGAVNRCPPARPHHETNRFIRDVYNRDVGCVPSDGGESIASMRKERVDPFWSDVEARHPESNDVFVTHGGTIRALRMRIEGIPDSEFHILTSDPMYKLGNCQTIIYSDVDPYSGAQNGRLCWVRSVCPPSAGYGGHDWYRF